MTTLLRVTGRTADLASRDDPPAKSIAFHRADGVASGLDAARRKYANTLRTMKLALEDGARGHGSLRDEARTPLLILIGATAMVLLIAIANAANLLIARSAQRRKELAIRAASAQAVEN